MGGVLNHLPQIQTEPAHRAWENPVEAPSDCSNQTLGSLNGGFSSPQEEALLQIMRSADSLHRAFQHLLKPSGLTATQYNVLRILRGAQPAGLTCSAIGASMITPEPDITRLLTRLKARKLIAQQRDAHDRRVVWTHISENGVGLLAQLDGLVDRAPRELLRALNCDEVCVLTRLLAKIQAGRQSGGSAEKVQTRLTGKPPLSSSPPALLPHSRPE